MGRFYFYLLLCIFTGMVSSCANPESDTGAIETTPSADPDPTAHCPEKDQSWTFLFYIVADDGSQSFDTSTARYLNTMPTLPENVEALVLLDRCISAYWPISTTDGRVLDTCAQLYRIQKDGTPKLLDMSPYKLSWLDDSSGDVNMGSATTLTSFIQFGMEQIETTNYGLILSGHGNGDQVGFDSTNDTSLNHQELGFALEKAMDTGDICRSKLDMVVMAACAMATAGVYSSLTPYVDWLIASQENIYGYDLNWMHKLGTESSNGSISKQEISTALIQSRVTGALGTGQQVTLDLSDENSETLQILVAEVGAILNANQTDRGDLEDAAFNQRTFDFRMVAEKSGDGALLETLDALLNKTVIEQTELSEELGAQLEAHGISVTTSDLGLAGSLIF
jgi:hypothetical protein